jgi:hypothetical protein
MYWFVRVTTRCTQGFVLVLLPNVSWGGLRAACVAAAATDYVFVTSGGASPSTWVGLEPELLVAEAVNHHWDLVGPWTAAPPQQQRTAAPAGEPPCMPARRSPAVMCVCVCVCVCPCVYLCVCARDELVTHAGGVFEYSIAREDAPRARSSSTLTLLTGDFHREEGECLAVRHAHCPTTYRDWGPGAVLLMAVVVVSRVKRQVDYLPPTYLGRRSVLQGLSWDAELGVCVCVCVCVCARALVCLPASVRTTGGGTRGHDAEGAERGHPYGCVPSLQDGSSVTRDGIVVAAGMW